MRVFEFGDLECVPVLYHIYLRKYLVFFYKVFGYYKLWVPGFLSFIKKIHAKTIMDCCSGDGDPLVLIDRCLDQDQVESINYLLSDIRPSKEVIERFNRSSGRFRYVESAIDVTNITEDFDYPKVFINSFHHFSSQQVEMIFDKNFSRKNEIIILEYVRNTPLGYVSMFVGPIVVMLTLPFVVSLRHLPIMALFTYAIPLFPLMLLWDGIVSCAHEYGRRDLANIVAKLEYDVEMTAEIRRNFLYPAGVSVITFTFPNKSN